MLLCRRWSFSDSRRWLLMPEFEPSRQTNSWDLLHVAGKTFLEIFVLTSGQKAKRPTMVNNVRGLCFLTDSYVICFCMDFWTCPCRIFESTAIVFKCLIFSKTPLIYSVTKWEHKNKRMWTVQELKQKNPQHRYVVSLILASFSN